MNDLMTLAEAARLIPGATKDTLLRLARAGNLTVYKVGKSYSTTRADLDKAIKARRVQCARDAESSAALNVALARLRGRKLRKI